MGWYRVRLTEVHEVVIETEAKDSDDAMNKVEEGVWDDNTFVVNDDTCDREVHSAEAIEDEDEE